MKRLFLIPQYLNSQFLNSGVSGLGKFSKNRTELEKSPLAQTWLDTLREWVIENNFFVILQHILAKSRQGRPQSPFTKGGSSRDARVY